MRVDVAMKPEAVIVPPSKYPLPATANLAEGEVVPMPTCPAEVITKAGVAPPRDEADSILNFWESE